jgi:hypothetical protein
MINSDTSKLSDSLVYEDVLPLSWAALDDGSSAVNYSRVAEHNEHILRCVNLLSDQIKEKVDDESETEPALVRMEAKINLILEMLSKLAIEREGTPQPVQIRVAATGIEWLCTNTQPSAGDKIQIKLHIDYRVPGALQLLGQVVSLTDTPSGTAVHARFEDVGEGVQDQLEKLIFRHHRRMVAQSKAK